MNDVLINLIYFLASYLIIFLIYVCVINRKKKTYTDAGKQMETNYLVSKFNLDRRKTKYTTIKWCINIINPFIISFTFVTVSNIKSYSLVILVAFVIMVVLVYSLYEIVGRILKKKESVKNV